MGIRFQVPLTGTDLNRLAWLLAKAGIHATLTDPASPELHAFVVADYAERAHEQVEVALRREEVRIGRATAT